MKNDTIAAIATPAGSGGIGIVRMSGPNAPAILEKLFGPEAAKKPRALCHGYIKDPETGNVVDEVLAVFMPEPATYTREDVVEINCHGGPLPLARTLELILRSGARMAEPGEFTRRAFESGRIDLSQAEAVIDVINAKTEESLEAAIEQLQGKFSEEIAGLREELVNALVDIDVNIDYPDEDIEQLTYEKLKGALERINEGISALIESATGGKILRDGLAVAIVGKPNVGKSSLLNLLLKESRAIVTDIPGTTRDTIEEFVNIRGIPVRLTDTAGIRNTDDEIEAIGIEKSKESIEKAELVLLLIDLSEEIGPETEELIAAVPPEKTILIFNKADKERRVDDARIASLGEGFADVLTVSLLAKDGIKKIEDAIFDASGYSAAKAGAAERKGSSVVTNLRHKAMLESAKRLMEDAIAGAEERAPLELIEIDVRGAYEELGMITGDSVQGDIIEEIFSRFCLGK